MRSIRLLTLALAMALAAFALSAQDAVSKAIASANAHYLVHEYDKAYSYASFVIRFYSGKEMTAEALDTCERVVAAYGEDLRQKERYETILALDQTLSVAPASVRAKAADAIAFAKAKVEERKAAEKKAEEERKLTEAAQRRQAEIDEALSLEKRKEAEREAERAAERKTYEEKEARLKSERDALAAQQRSELDRIIRENREVETAKERSRTEERVASQKLQAELERQRLESDAKYREELAKILEMSNKSGAQAYASISRASVAVVVGLGVLGFIVLAGIALIVVMNLRQQAIQHEQFQSTIAAMTNLRNAQDLSTVALPFIAQSLQALPQAPQPVKMIEQKAVGRLPSGGSAGMNTPDELKALYEKCLAYAEQIDEVTNRKNASRRVAELVYKISKSLGYAEHDALLFYTVGLVYDIGFLNIDPVILRSEHISEEQFAAIKSHTTLGVNMVFFIDPKNRQFFKDGVSMHHENLDGTGYPKGLKGADIPYIARVLRIAETYIALVSNRDYKEIKDRDSAIKELMTHENHYDLSIVKVLDEIV